MLGKKKKSEKSAEELENSNSLFKNTNLIEYQNKSLFISLQSSKKTIEEKNFLISKYKKANDSLSAYFIKILKSLSNFSKSLSILDGYEENPISNNLDLFSELSKDSYSALEIFAKSIDGPEITEEKLSFVSLIGVHLESIENKLTKLITNLLNAKISKNNNQFTKLIDEGLNEEMVEFLNREIVVENKTLRREIERLSDLIENSSKQINSSQSEILLVELSNKNREIAEINKNLEEMKIYNRQVKQKLNSSPYLPYIIVEGSTSVNLKHHNCLCYYCGFEQSNSNVNTGYFQNMGNESNSIRNSSMHLDEFASKHVNFTNNPDTNMQENFPSGKNERETKNVFSYKVNPFENSDNLKHSQAIFVKYNSEKTNDLPLNEENFEEKNKFDTDLENFTSKDQNIVNTNQMKRDAISPKNFTALANSNSPNNSTENNANNIQDESEKQNIIILYRRLYDSYINLKCEKVFSTQSLIKSKPFQVLLGQMENIIVYIEGLKAEISNLKMRFNDINAQLVSQEKFLKADKMKDVCLLEEKIEKLQKDTYIIENEKIRIQLENTKNEELIKTLKNFDYSQLTAIEDYYKTKNPNLLEMIKSQAKAYSDKYQIEYEKCECLEKANLKLQMEMDRFKTALSKYENVEGVENLQYEKFDMREREEMKRQIKNYRDKFSNCEKHYKTLKSELKIEKETSEKFFYEICLNEKGIEQMNKTIKEQSSSIQENNEKIGFLLSEKSKNTETIRNLNDYIEKLESEIKDSSEIHKEIKNLEENYMKELNYNKEIIKKYETFVKFKNANIDVLYQQIHQLMKKNSSLENSKQDLEKIIENLKGNYSKKLIDMERALNKDRDKDPNKNNYVFNDKKLEEEFNLLNLENENFKKKLQCKVCCLRNIDIIINKCNHTFCRECIEKMLNTRQRTCPKCRHKISIKDVSDIWID